MNKATAILLLAVMIVSTMLFIPMNDASAAELSATCCTLGQTYYVCRGQSINAGSDTHLYSFFKTCIRHLKQSYCQQKCSYCNKLLKTATMLHLCYRMHDNCGKNRENLCYYP